MTRVTNKLVKHFIVLIVFVSCSEVKAQVSFIQELIDRLESYNNFSYQSLNKKIDMSADTIVAVNKGIFLRAPKDDLFGHYYSIETNYKTDKFHRIDLYNQNGLTALSISDSTFFPEKQYSAYDQSLLGSLRFLKDRYSHKPFGIHMLKDTIIKGVINSHLIANVYDTIDNKEHFYSNRNYYINKKTGLPNLVTIHGRSLYNGLINNYFDQIEYYDYKLNAPDISDADFVIPKGFKPREDKPDSNLLTVGTAAPDWKLTDVNGRKVSLSQLKGKVVVLDFYFIRCSGCIQSIKPLNAIYAKYQKEDVVIASLNERDSQKAVIEFEKRYDIKYPSYTNAAEVVKSYQVTAFPTYYFIDKEGKIANVFVGYSDEFEQKVTTAINNILSKK